VGRIIRICKFALCAAVLTWPADASAPSEDLVGRYASARVAEIGEQDSIALNGYLRLYKQAPDSEILADRLFDSAIRSGVMATALRAARAKELRNGGNSETALLLFADAWRAKNWKMADLSADELSVGGNLGFMSPMLKSWVRVAQGRSADLAEGSADTDGFFAYYSADQRIYLDLASGQFAKAKLGLRAIATQSGEHVRDVMIAGADTLAGKEGGDPAFAEALMRSAVGSTEGWVARGGKMSAERGLSALYARIALALIEQGMPKEGLVLARIGNWISPAQASVQLTLAKSLNANALTGEALKLLGQFPASSPYRIAALENRIDMLIATKDVAKAKEVVAEAQESAPNSVATKLLYARVQEAAGNIPLVISTYREMTEAADFAKLPPRQQASYRLLLASTLDRAGQWPSAKAELEKLLTVDPNNAQALNYLGYSLLERDGERERATEMVKRAYALEPTSAAITDSLGWAYFLQGDTNRALPLLEKATKDAGSDIAINEHLGDAYWTLGRRRDARYAWGVANQGSEGEAAARLSRKIDIGLADTPR
jgi:tetratricopeptide (TPR) repeat protein